VHSARVGKAPVYITSLMHPVSDLSDRHTSLRSATNEDLFVPHTRLKFGNQAFKVAASRLWNDLPLDIRSTRNIQTFKINLILTCFTELTNSCSLHIFMFSDVFILFYFYSFNCIEWSASAVSPIV